MNSQVNLGKINITCTKHVWKPGVRAIGVAESFAREDRHSTVVGVVMRGDFRVDGLGICTPTVGGVDSTQALIDMYRRLNRRDIRAWMLGGSVISWFNPLDLQQIHETTSVPIVCVSYDPSQGIERYIKEYFPNDWMQRMSVIQRNGERTEVQLSSGHQVFLNVFGMGIDRARSLVDQFTLDGRVPEPIRVARIIASSIRRDLSIFTNTCVKLDR